MKIEIFDVEDMIICLC